MAETRLEDQTEDRVKPKTALVTGGSGIIGAAIAEALGRAGFRVVVHYHHGEELAAGVVDRIVVGGGQALAVEADVSQQSSVTAMFERIEREYGPVDYLINNAGINRDVLLAFMSEELWDEVIDTKLRGRYVC